MVHGLKSACQKALPRADGDAWWGSGVALRDAGAALGPGGDGLYTGAVWHSPALDPAATWHDADSADAQWHQ